MYIYIYTVLCTLFVYIYIYIVYIHIYIYRGIFCGFLVPASSGALWRCPSLFLWPLWDLSARVPQLALSILQMDTTGWEADCIHKPYFTRNSQPVPILQGSSSTNCSDHGMTWNSPCRSDLNAMLLEHIILCQSLEKLYQYSFPICVYQPFPLIVWNLRTPQIPCSSLLIHSYWALLVIFPSSLPNAFHTIPGSSITTFPYFSHTFPIFP